jgi:hypothetical protein
MRVTGAGAGATAPAGPRRARACRVRPAAQPPPGAASCLRASCQSHPGPGSLALHHHAPCTARALGLALGLNEPSGAHLAAPPWISGRTCGLCAGPAPRRSLSCGGAEASPGRA